MTTNGTILQKADIAVADLQSNGGYLQPEQAAAFIRKLIAEPTVLKSSRLVTMTSPQRQINKIGFGSRILRPAVSGVALTQSERSKADLGKVTLTTKEVIAEIRLPYDVVEDNIERAMVSEQAGSGPGTISMEGIKGTIMDMIAQRAALDLEELALLGDTASADSYLALTDGYLKLAANGGHVVNANNTPISRALFKAGTQAMPSQYLRNKAAMVNYVSYSQELEYRDQVAARIGALGDATLQGTGDVYASGIVVKAAALMPGSKGLLTNPQNMIFGIQRQIMIETAKDITTREYIIVLTARVDFKIEETDAIVTYTGMTGG